MVSKGLILALLTVGFSLPAAAMASQYKDTAVDRCSTKDHKGQYEHISLKLDSKDKTKVLVVAVSMEGDTSLLSGEIVSRTSKINAVGANETVTTALLEDGSTLLTDEVGDTEATAKRNGQTFDCGD